MPQRKSLVTVIRDMVREQVQEAVQGLLGTVGGGRREYRKSKNGRRRRRRPRTGPATGVEDSDASGTRASAQGRAGCTADGDAKAAQATWAGTPTEAGEG